MSSRSRWLPNQCVFLVAGQGDRDSVSWSRSMSSAGAVTRTVRGVPTVEAGGRDGGCSGEAPHGRAPRPQPPLVSEGRVLAGPGDGGDVAGAVGCCEDGD